MGSNQTSSWVDITLDTYIDENDAAANKDGDRLLVRAHIGGDLEKAALLRFTIPDRETLGAPDNALSISDIEIQLYEDSASGVFTSTASVYALTSSTSNWVENLVDWNTTDGVGTWNPDFGGSGGDIAYATFAGSDIWGGMGSSAQWRSVSLTNAIESEGWDFGSTVSVILYVNGYEATLYDETETNGPQFRVTWEVPTPDAPSITVTPQENRVDGYINITEHTQSPARESYLILYDADSTVTAASAHDSNETITETNTRIDQISTVDFTVNPLGTQNQDYAFRVIAQDGVNTLDNGGSSNVVVIKRPIITSSVAYYGYTEASDANADGTVWTGSDIPTIGQEVALRVVAATKFKSVWVNWDAGASDVLWDDYTEYSMANLDTETDDNASITYKYSTDGAKSIKTIIVDSKGWRSGKNTLGPPAIVEENPIPVLTPSRTKFLSAKYGDRTTGLVLSGSQSHAVGSNRKISNYLFTQSAALKAANIVTGRTLVTANAMSNDNSQFDNVSRIVAITTTGNDDLSGTKFKIFGLASFTSDGSPVADNNTATFSHYKFASETQTCSATRVTGESTGNTNYFKTIECVVCIEEAGTTVDDGNRYILRVKNSEDATKPVINKELRVIGNSASNTAAKYMWGGLAKIKGGNIDFDHSNHKIELDSLSSSGSDSSWSTNADWAAAGFWAGDIIKVGNSTNNGTYAVPKYFKIASIAAPSTLYDEVTIETSAANLTAEELTYVTTSVTSGDTNTTADIIRHDNAAQPSLTCAAYNTANQDDTITFSHTVVDDDPSGWLVNIGTAVTEDVRLSAPITLDLNTEVDSGHIALQDVSFDRSGGITSAMPLGERRYPVGVMRTKVGLPKVSLKLNILTQTGLTKVWSMIEGDTYDYIFLDSRKVDDPTQPHRTLRMRLESGGLVRTPALANQYEASCNFVVLGEDVAV